MKVRATPFRPVGGPNARSIVLATLARLWDKAVDAYPSTGRGKVTQRLLSDVSGIPRSTVSSWATGSSLPRDVEELAAVGNTLAKWAGEREWTVAEWSRLLTADHDVRDAGPAEKQLQGSASSEADEPIIASVRLADDNFTRSRVVVDADPPRAVWRSGDVVVVNLEARPARAVFLHSIQPVVVGRRPPGRACFGLSGTYLAGGLGPRKFTLDLDKTPSRVEAVRPTEDSFPFKITRDDVEQFRIEVKSVRDVVSCYFEIDWTCNGADGRTAVGDKGNAFEIYPGSERSSELHWGCGQRHRFGCPAERLAAQSSQGEVLSLDGRTGAGRIRPDGGGAEIYFHLDEVEVGTGFVSVGFRVTYEVARTRFEPHAVRVRRIQEGGSFTSHDFLREFMP